MSVSWGRNLKALGILCFVVAFLAGLASCVIVVNAVAGEAIAVVSVLLAPVTFIIVPWYAGLVLGDWLPFLLNYCAGSLALVLYAAGNWLLREDGDH